MDGILVIDKPAGWTSHDVVAKVRRLTGVRRVGHAGTLDPLATGVLPLGIGQGTRVLEYLSNSDKRYTARLRLGAATDTYDADGTVTERGDWQHLTEAAVRTALATFAGAIEQRPPAYSAIKQGGVPLHKLARRGVAVEAPLREVTVYTIEVLDLQLPDVVFDVWCSKGTYVRSLAHDLGARLGCGAHLTALRRTATGSLTADEAIDLKSLVLADGNWPRRLLPLDTPLLDRPAIILDEADARRLADGVPPAGVIARDPASLHRAYTPSGAFAALLWSPGATGGWRIEKVFPLGAQGERVRTEAGNAPD